MRGHQPTLDYIRRRTAEELARFEPGEALMLMEQERCTHFSGKDTIALMLLTHPDRPLRRLTLRGA